MDNVGRVGFRGSEKQNWFLKILEGKYKKSGRIVLLTNHTNVYVNDPVDEKVVGRKTLFNIMANQPTPP